MEHGANHLDYAFPPARLISRRTKRILLLSAGMILAVLLIGFASSPWWWPPLDRAINAEVIRGYQQERNRLAALIKPVLSSAIHSLSDIAIAGLAAAALIALRAPPIAIVIGCALAADAVSRLS